MQANYNKIADQKKTTQVILNVLLKYQGSARAVRREFYYTIIHRCIALTCTSRGFTSIYTVLNQHSARLFKRGYTPEQVQHSKADILDMAILELNAE